MKTTSIWQGCLVRLRAVEPDDWATFFDWWADTEYDRYTDTKLFPASRETLKKWTTGLALTEPWAKDHNFRMMVENLAGEVVGTINSHTCNLRMGTF